MNPFTSALLFIVPCLSLSLLLLHPPARLPLFAFFSLGFLFIVAASLGLAAHFDETHRVVLNVGKQVVVNVIQFELDLAVLFIFAEVVVPAIVSPKKILLYNTISFVFIDISTILSLLSVFLSPTSLPFVTPFVFTLISQISPLPILAIILHSQPTRLNKKATRFWVVLVVAQLFSVLYCIFHFLAAVSIRSTFVQVFGSVFMILWATSIMINFYLLPSSNPEFNRTTLRLRITPSPSPSHVSFGRTGSPDASDFLNLRDPFASPPVSPTSEKFSISPFGSPQNSQRMFRSNISKLSISSSAQTLFGSSPPPATAMSLGHQKDAIGPLEDVDLDQEEAILSQILLQTLDSQLNLPRERTVSDSELAGLGLGLGFGQGAQGKPRTKRKNLVIVTCERRGSESTIVAGSISDTTCDSPNSQMTACTSSPQRKTRKQKSSSSTEQSVSVPRTAQEYLQEGIVHHEANRLAESAACFEKSAKNGGGCCLGMVMWGLSLRHGWGCEQDTAEGFKWLREAAVSAVNDLGSNNTIESEVNGVQDSSFGSSVSIYGLSEVLITAIYDIGQCFFQGEGVRRDVKISLFFYTIAARAGAATLANYESPLSAGGKERDLPPLPTFSKTTARPLSTVFDHEHLSMSRFESLQNEPKIESPDYEDDMDTPRALTPATFVS